MKKNTKDGAGAAAASDNVQELLYQALETELGGVDVYRAALLSVVNDDLREEWTKYLAQTEEHVRRLRAVCESAALDPDVETPGRKVVRLIGKSLVQAIEMARGGDDPAAAELVAAECVVHAETKDHMNWSMIGMLAKEQGGPLAEELAAAHAEIEDQEDQHLYHSMGWARELWVQALGMSAVLPPPEEAQNAKSAIAAARAKQSRMGSDAEATRGARSAATMEE